MRKSDILRAICLFALMATPALADYASTVLGDSPIAYWRMSETEVTEWFPATIANSGTAGSPIDGVTEGDVVLDVPGPTTSGFAPANSAAEFSRSLAAHAIRVTDPGAGSVLDFGAGESITLEFWAKPNNVSSGYQTYVIGKGRDTSEATDQNYSMRITPSTGVVSSLFRLADDSAWAQWDTPPLAMFDGNWHHFAFTHTFGDDSEGSGSSAFYFDGYDLTNEMTWSFAGTPAGLVASAQDAAPIQSDGDLLLGYNPSRGNYDGVLDEVAVYRSALSPATVQSHVTAAGATVATESPVVPPPPAVPAPSGTLFNGDFEIPTTVLAPVEYGWTEWSSTTAGQGHTAHSGLNSSGLAPGGQAIQMAQHTGQLAQHVVSGAEWEVEFLAASEVPDGGRAINFWVCHDGNESTSDGNQINLKVEADGGVYAYDDLTVNDWVLLGSTGEFLFSTDGDADGKLESVEDTLNVHKIKIVGDYSVNPSYDVFISEANSETLIQIADDVGYFQTSAPTPGSGPTGVGFSPYRQRADVVIDQVAFATVNPIPGDANGDGAVDEMDARALAMNWGASSANWSMGDFSGDGIVNVMDAAILAANWSANASEAATSVPEPASAAWLVILLAIVALRRRSC